jgi:hypothetical protein
MNVGSGFHCLRSFSFLEVANKQREVPAYLLLHLISISLFIPALQS